MGKQDLHPMARKKPRVRREEKKEEGDVGVGGKEAQSSLLLGGGVQR